jgi:hypothetical protein
MKLLIVQPWFDSMGHPAQSLINLASAIGRDERVEYLVSSSSESRFFQDSVEQLRQWGKVVSYVATAPTGDSNTVRALLALCRMRLNGQKYQRIFFFDGSLYALALRWPFFSILLPVERISVLHLLGPNLRGGSRNRWKRRYVIERFLRRSDVRFYLRTEELAAAWCTAIERVESGHIRYLPSLEIPDDEHQQYPKRSSSKLAFGIIGQIRLGKSMFLSVSLRSPANSICQKHGMKYRY